MSVDVDKLKVSFSNKVNDLYNQDVYFVDSCYKFPNKYSLEGSILDDQLRIFFEENNKIVLEGCIVPYCTMESRRKIRLINIATGTNMPEVEVENYVIENTWRKIDW